MKAGKILTIAGALCLAAMALGALAGCATQTPQEAALAACTTFSKSLRVLAVARYQGRLTVAQSDMVDQAIEVAYPICTAPEPPDNADTLVGNVNAALETIIFSLPQEKK